MALHVDPVKRELLEARIQGSSVPSASVNSNKPQDINSSQLSSDDPSKCGVSSNSGQHTADNASLDVPFSTVTSSYCTTSVTAPGVSHPPRPATANLVQPTYSSTFLKDVAPLQINTVCLNSDDRSFGDLPGPSGVARNEDPLPDHKQPPSLPLTSDAPVDPTGHSMSNPVEESSISCPSADGVSIKCAGALFNFQPGSVAPTSSSYCANRQMFQNPYSTNSVLSNQSMPCDHACQSNPMLPPVDPPAIMTTPPKKMRNASGAAAVLIAQGANSARCSNLNSPNPGTPTTPRSAIRRKRKAQVLDEQGIPLPKRPTHKGTKRIDEMFKVRSSLIYIFSFIFFIFICFS